MESPAVIQNRKLQSNRSSVYLVPCIWYYYTYWLESRIFHTTHLFDITDLEDPIGILALYLISET